MNNHSALLHFNEDLLFVAGEPLEDLLNLVEDSTNKDSQLLGHIVILVSTIKKRLDERHVASSPIFIFVDKENCLDLVVKLKSHRKTHGLRDKDIGEVRVLILEPLEGFGDDHDAAENEKHMSKSIVTSDSEAQGALAFSYKFGRTVEHPPTDPNVKQRPKRGVNGFARSFVEGLGEGLIGDNAPEKIFIGKCVN
nr:protein quirky [Quercus suber]